MKEFKTGSGFLLGAAVSLWFWTSAVTAAADSATTNAPDPWQPIRVLLGKWEGAVQGEPGSGKCEREYRFTLGGRFIHVSSKSMYPKQEKNPKGETHEDESFFSYDRQARKLVLRQFHIEGFVNQYVLDSVSDDGRTVVFVSSAIENIAPGWRARETYRIISQDEFVETFALAGLGKDFATYSETHFRRKLL